jgi:lipopolysaccharide export system protein LptC
MKLRTQSLFPVAILTLLAALTFWLERATHIEAPREDGRKRHDPDYMAEKFTVRRFGPTGALQNTLSAQKMVHYPDDDTTLASEPRLAYLGSLRPTQLSAKEGLIGADAQEIVLIGDVRAVRKGAGKDPDLVIASSTLTIFPDDEVARTSAPVVITQGKSVVHGVGLEADNKTAIYQLLSQVNGIIDKKRP